MNAFTWRGSILALLTYYPLWKQIRSGGAKQNLLTWALWCILDAVVAATIIDQKGSFLLPITYALGSSVTVFFIWKAGNKAAWTWFETMVASLTIASMVIWYFSGGKVATVASTMAMIIGGIPQLIDAWKKPQDMPILPYTSYFVANCLSAAGGKSWAIEERFYPLGAAIFCLSIAVLSIRKFRLKTKPVNLIGSCSENG
jgi:hypothetical protein